MNNENSGSGFMKSYEALIHGKVNQVKVGKRVCNYTIQEKITILKEYEQGLSTETWGWKSVIAKKYKIHQSQINKWMATRSNLLSLNQLKNNGLLNQNHRLMNISRKSLNPGKSVRYPLIERWLYHKFEELR